MYSAQILLNFRNMFFWTIYKIKIKNIFNSILTLQFQCRSLLTYIYNKYLCLIKNHNYFNILLVCLRYAKLSLSTAKYPTVAPYSGHILEIVARSAILNCDTPEPKNSTNFPTTPTWRRFYKYSVLFIY